MKILAIGAHPDDVEVGCGGCLLKHSKAKNDVYIYFLTRGEAGGASAEQREKEARNSAQRIGVKGLWFGEYLDTALSPTGELVNNIEAVINRVGPDLIFTHTRNDEHHDHRAVALSTIEAARYYPRILSYEIPLTKDFAPQMYFDISDVIHEKVELIAIYNSQKNKRYLIRDAIYGLAQYRALQSRIRINGSYSSRFVEAFQVVKYILTI